LAGRLELANIQSAIRNLPVLSWYKYEYLFVDVGPEKKHCSSKIVTVEVPAAEITPLVVGTLLS
jgi:hypothetical protein